MNGTRNPSNYGNAAVTLVSAGNASLTDYNSTSTVIGSGTNIGGNLTVTNSVSSITDSAGTAGVIVSGATSFIAPYGSAILTNPYDQFNSGLLGQVATSGTLAVNVNGPLTILGGTTAGTGIFVASGNITNVTTATSKFVSLSLTSSAGNVTLTDPIWITGTSVGSLRIYAPIGKIDLGGIYQATDLSGTAPTILSPNAGYTPPKP